MVKQLSIRMAVLSFVMVLLLVAFALSEALGQQSRPLSGGTLRLAVWSDLTRNLDARYVGPSTLYPPFFQIYEFLVGYSSKGMQEIIPWLAESWKQVDPVTYLFNIRKGVKFHNGREMTAEDIKTLLDWNLKTPEGWRPLNRHTYLARVIDKVEIVDRYTVWIRLRTPFAPLMATFRMVQQGVAPPEEVKKWGKDFTLHPSGTGPYKFVEQVPGDRVVLERFEGYWAKRPYLDRVIFRTIPDEQARVIALQTGEVDGIMIYLASLPVVRKDPKLTSLEVYQLANYIGVWFNMRKWPMSSLKFRTAVAAGAEWPKFPMATYAGIAVRTPLERSWAENPRAKELLPAYDPEKARRLIKEVEAEAGRAIPTLVFLVPTIYEMTQMIELAKTQLKKIGVELKLDMSPSPAASIQALKWDMVLISTAGPGADPYFLLNAFSTGGEGDMPDGKNRMGYVNPRIDELLKRTAMTDDRSARGKIYQEIEGILLKDLPGFYVWNPPAIWVMNKKVKDPGLPNDGSLYLTTPWNNTWMER